MVGDPMARTKQAPRSWKVVRSVLRGAGHKDLLSLVGDLYALRKENQVFLHARFIKDGNTLVPYMEAIERYMFPEEPWKHRIEISHARKAISDYRKALGDLPGLAELKLFYVECGVSFTLEYGDIDEAFYDSLESMFSNGLKTLKRCGPDAVGNLLPRFQDVVRSTEGMGWGFYDGLLAALEKHFPNARRDKVANGL